MEDGRGWTHNAQAISLMPHTVSTGMSLAIWLEDTLIDAWRDIHMSADIGRLTEGVTVIAQAGEEIGRVKEIRASDFLMDMTMRRDLFVPFSAISEVSGTVVLNVAAEEIGDQGWEPAPLFGMSDERSANAATPAPDREDRVVGTGDPAERGTWSASSDSYSLDALDTTEGRQAMEGTDDGQRPRTGDTSEFEKLRDMSG